MCFDQEEETSFCYHHFEMRESTWLFIFTVLFKHSSIYKAILPFYRFFIVVNSSNPTCGMI